MHNTTSRRRFLRTATALAAGVSAGASFGFGAEPFKRTGKPKLVPALAAYSFRQFFTDGKGADGKAEAGRKLDMFGFIDYCAEQDCAAEVTSYYFPANPDGAYLLKLKRHAFLRGVPLSGTAIGNTFTHPHGPKRDEQIQLAKTWIDRAAVMGAPHIRIFAGNAQGTSKEEAKKLCIETTEEVCAYAGSKGVMLGLENHGGIVSEPGDLLDIVRAVKSPWLGINLDSGNFHTDDPYRDIELCAPYAVNVQFKAEVQARGKRKEPGDLRRVVKILRDANYQGFFALEYESAEDPWQAVPQLLTEMRDAIS